MTPPSQLYRMQPRRQALTGWSPVPAPLWGWGLRWPCPHSFSGHCLSGNSGSGFSPSRTCCSGGSIFPNVNGTIHALRAQPLGSAGIPPRFTAHPDPLPQHLRSAAGAFGSKAYNVKQPKAPLLRSICFPSPYTLNL